MKKALIIISAALMVVSCKKSLKNDPSTTTVYYVKVIAVDNDGTMTETKPAIVKVTQ